MPGIQSYKEIAGLVRPQAVDPTGPVLQEIVTNLKRPLRDHTRRLVELICTTSSGIIPRRGYTHKDYRSDELLQAYLQQFSPKTQVVSGH